MNKLLTKTVKKVTIMSIVIAVLLIASFLITFFVGANYGIATDDMATLTVTVDDYHFNNEASIVKVESVCETTFASPEVNVEPKITYRGEMSADSELVYAFEYGTDLSKAKTALKKAFETEQAKADSPIVAAEISVSTGSELLKAEIAWGYVWRAVGAAALFAVLAFVYVALRYRLNMGILTAVCALLAPALSAAIILLTRIPFTAASFYAMAISSMIATVFVLFNLNKLRANLKSEEAADKSAEELIVSSTATKEITVFTAIMGVALILVGAIATAAVRYFALASLVSLIVAAFVGLVFAPALYLPMKKRADKKAEGVTASGYQGAKKTSEQED
ncbi:MAG: hypothetical protein IJX91_01645 [Clostridia bacterium]|nr:hypothetical protein [Clostridia bacterium]